MASWIQQRQSLQGSNRTSLLCEEEVRNYRVAGDLFADLVGNRKVVDITEEDLVNFRAMLHRVPSLFGRGPYRAMTASEAIRKADGRSDRAVSLVEAKAAAGEIDPDNLRHELQSAKERRLAMKTINKHLDKIKGLLRWLAETKKVPINRDLLALKLRYGVKEFDRSARNDRDAFLNAELRELFASPAWSGCAGDHHRHRRGKHVVKDAKYWLPLMMAHQGLRLGEAAQLLTEDIVAVQFDEEHFAEWDIDVRSQTGVWARLRRFLPAGQDGSATFAIWCIKVMPDEEKGKRVKTGTSKRIVPIHPLLLELGFLDYHADQKVKGKIDLFPGLKSAKALRSGAKLGEWFGRYLEYVGMAREGLCLYSLRHSFDTHLLNRQIPEIQVSELMGHVQQGQTGSRYYKGASLARLVEAIASIDYRLHVGIIDDRLTLLPNE
ncbi:site-specific integrase [Skermanella pratensis]|uniref:site-specific integrase n=1 Tax=Skermanella pratensis TaxID=2233999 RepID=UPI0013018CA0|nr:site-specific integrase [Skermanella pratensis]